jgi:hypothetical protein
MLIDRLERVKPDSAAEGRELEALSKVLDRIMPYDHLKLSQGDTPEHPHHVNVDLSGLTDEELEYGERLAIKIGLGRASEAWFPLPLSFRRLPRYRRRKITCFIEFEKPAEFPQGASRLRADCAFAFPWSAASL